jgi:hypothetical protein
MDLQSYIFPHISYDEQTIFSENIEAKKSLFSFKTEIPSIYNASKEKVFFFHEFSHVKDFKNRLYTLKRYKS